MPSIKFAFAFLLSLPLCLHALAETASAPADSAVTEPTLIILQYHHISDNTPPETSTSPSLFKQQMALIKDLKLPVLPLSDALQRLRQNKLNGTAVVVTFDDAYESIYSTARPTLKEYRYPYTLFVNTDPIDGKREGFMSWDNIRQLAREGVIIGNHSSDHSHYLRRSGETAEENVNRIKNATWKGHQRIVEEIGMEPRFFAYPYGEYDASVIDVIKTYGYTAFGQQSGAIGAVHNNLALPRFPASNAYGTIASLREKLLSLPFPRPNGTDETIVVTNPPVLSLTLANVENATSLRCFTSGRGIASVKWKDTVATVKATRPLERRRERYNCTLRAPSGRYYWLSQPWFNTELPED